MTIELYNGDCLEVMKDIPNNSIDMILCDLPYGITQNKWDIIIPLDLLWIQYKRLANLVVLFAQSPFDKVLGCSNLIDFRYEWIWQKGLGTGFLNANRMPMKIHENILVFYKNLPPYNPQFIQGSKYIVKRGRQSTNYGKANETITINDGKRYPTSIITIPHDQQSFHPTQKPVLLMEYLIKTYTNENDTILDNCMGSGTTGVACKNLNRNFIGIELVENYFNIAKNRIDNTNSLEKFMEH